MHLDGPQLKKNRTCPKGQVRTGDRVTTIAASYWGAPNFGVRLQNTSRRFPLSKTPTNFFTDRNSRKKFSVRGFTVFVMDLASFFPLPVYFQSTLKLMPNDYGRQMTSNAPSDSSLTSTSKSRNILRMSMCVVECKESFPVTKRLVSP